MVAPRIRNKDVSHALPCRFNLAIGKQAQTPANESDSWKRRADGADSAIAVVRYEQIAGGIKGQPLRPPQSGSYRGSIVAGEAADTITGDGGDNSGS